MRASSEEAGMLAAFFRRVWDPVATEESVRRSRRAAAAANLAAPGEEPPTYILVAEGEVAGHITTLPTRLWTHGEERSIHWLKGLMVIPEHRNGPVGFLVLREAVKGVGDAMAMVAQPEARRLFQALGFKDLGPVPNHLLVLNPARVIRRISPEAVGRPLGKWTFVWKTARLAPVASAVGGVIRGAGAAWASVASPTGRYRAEGGLPDVAALEQLWVRMRARLTAAPTRCAAGLVERYVRDGASRYLPVTVRRAGTVVGVAFVRRPHDNGDPRLNGVRVATLSDLVCDPDSPRDLAALLEASASAARAAAADVLLCSASDSRLRAALRRRAFLSLSGNIHFLARAEGSSASLEGWWLMRGDSAADEVF